MATGGTTLLSQLPAGADAVVEVDLRRLRDNPTVGGVSQVLASQVGPLRGVDVLVVAIYDLGRPEPVALVLSRGDKGDAVVYGSPEVRAKLGAGGASMADEAAFMELRNEAMPVRALGASLRLTARLDRAARRALAERVGWAEAPETVSVWLEVADDLALVALLRVEDEADGERTAQAVRDMCARLATWVPARFHLARLLDGMKVRHDGERVRLVWILGPRKLRRAATDLCAALPGCGRLSQASHRPSRLVG